MPCYHVDRIEGNIAVLDPDAGGDTIDVPRGNLQEGQAVCMGQEAPEYYFDDYPGLDTDPAGGGGTPFDPGAVDYAGYGDIAGSGAYGTEAGYMDSGADLDTDPLGGLVPGASLSGFTDNAAGGMTLANSWQAFGGLFSGKSGNGSSAPRAATAGVSSSGARAGALVRSIRDTTGLRITARAIVGLIVKYGFPAAAALTRLGLQDLLFLFMREKGVRHHRRGPGLYTVARKLRAAASLQRTVSRILGHGRGYHRRRRGGYHTMRRRSRRRR